MRSIMFAALAVATLFAPLPAVAETFTPGQENQEDYPDGAGREQTFYACIACHGFKLVAQQGQTRAQWDDTLNWMTQKHGMPPLDGDLRKLDGNVRVDLGRITFGAGAIGSGSFASGVTSGAASTGVGATRASTAAATGCGSWRALQASSHTTTTRHPRIGASVHARRALRHAVHEFEEAQKSIRNWRDKHAQ